MASPLHQSVLGVPVRTQTMQALLAELSVRLSQRLPTQLFLANAHMLMEARTSAALKQLLQSSAFVLADGRPVCWWLSAVHRQPIEQIRGFDLMMALLTKAADAQWRVGFYGGQNAGQLAALVATLRQKLPALQVVYQHAPPFETPAGTDPAQLAAMRTARVDLLLVGLGCPKQEYWIAGNSAALPPLQLGVGAAFDYLSGRLWQAPPFLQRLGLEWLVRWWQEPRRLSGRYIRHNPVFLWHFLQACWQARRQREGHLK